MMRKKVGDPPHNLGLFQEHLLGGHGLDHLEGYFSTKPGPSMNQRKTALTYDFFKFNILPLRNKIIGWLRVERRILNK